MNEATLTPVLRQHGHTITSVAAAMNVDKSTVSRWFSKQVPAERVLEVERVTGISRHELRPDVFGPREHA